MQLYCLKNLGGQCLKWLITWVSQKTYFTDGDENIEQEQGILFLGMVGQVLLRYLEVYYNRQRKYSVNGYKAPAQYEMEWWNDRKAA